MTLQSSDLVCWHCGQNLRDIPLPFSRFAQCPACRSELHVCLMCRHYDPRYTSQCRHDSADKVLDKDRANFCAHLRPRKNAHSGREENGAARDKLAVLFDDDTRNEELSGDGQTDENSAAARSRRALNDLFDTED